MPRKAAATSPPAPSPAPVTRSSSRNAASSPAWTSAASLGSLFSPSPTPASSTKKDPLADDASTSSSLLDLGDSTAPSAASSTVLPPAAASAASRPTGAAASAKQAYRRDEPFGAHFHSTPIPPGALVLLDSKSAAAPSAGMPLPASRSSAGATAPTASRSPSAAPQPPAAAATSSGRRREYQTNIWPGPKKKMSRIEAWKMWYGTITVTEMLEPVRLASLGSASRFLDGTLMRKRSPPVRSVGTGPLP